MGTTTLVTGVLAQLQEFLDIHMPGLQVGTHCALALATLVHCHGSVIGNLEERHNTLGLAVGALDMRTQCAHPCPVITQAAGKF